MALNSVYVALAASICPERGSSPRAGTRRAAAAQRTHAFRGSFQQMRRPHASRSARTTSRHTRDAREPHTTTTSTETT